MEASRTSIMLKDTVEINSDKLPLTDGQIHFIRKVDNEGSISEYVWATICLADRKMKVYYQAKDQNAAVLLKDFEYNVNVAINPIRQDIWKS
ncbi:MAG: hypothetical protein U9O85_00220 [Euryarchaeota archaeon]|nr:hypothetical protein [Euryarchaeota archaeon]